MAEPAPVTDRELLCGRIAAVVVGLEAALLAGLTIFYAVALFSRPEADAMMVIMSAIMLAIFAIALGYVSYGLWRRHPRAQAPALAVNILAVPLGSVLYAFVPWPAATAVLIAAIVVVFSAGMMGQPGRPADA